MLNSLRKELSTIVFRFIESYNSLNVPLLENLAVLIRSKARPLPRFSAINRTHKGSELARNDPIYVSIVYSFIILVFLDIKCLEIVPLEPDTVFESLQAVKDCALVVTVTLGSIAEGDKLIVISPESVKSFLRRALQHDYHEGTHEEGRIR